MKVSVITLFPEVFENYMGTSMMWKARGKGLLELEFINLRDFGIGPRKQVDDTPYGGGDGMVLRADVVIPAIEHARSQIPNSKFQIPNKHQNSKSKKLSSTFHLQSSTTILLTPKGQTFTQAKARELSSISHLILVCGHYEGFDERVHDYVDEQISIGDYVLTGGELPAMVVIDSVARLVPGVLGGESSALNESFSDGKTLEHPHYTRPEEFRGKKVPGILRSGHHADIATWREGHTKKVRS